MLLMLVQCCHLRRSPCLSSHFPTSARIEIKRRGKADSEERFAKYRGRRKERGREPDASREHTMTEYGSPNCCWQTMKQLKWSEFSHEGVLFHCSQCEEVGLFLEQVHSGSLCSPGSCSGLALTGLGAEALIPGVLEGKPNLEEAQEVTKRHCYPPKRGLPQYHL